MKGFMIVIGWDDGLGGWIFVGCCCWGWGGVTERRV